jgi:predicted chitinase
MRSVSEKIDERILRLLGLEDVFDIDYDTYLTLLKEVIVAGSKKLPQEELALLANERKRIRGKKGRFSPKKDKITASKVATTKLLKGTKKTLALPPSQINMMSGGFDGIGKTLDSILKTLGSKFKFDQKQADEDRKEKETEKRGKRESTLEGFKKGVAGIVATTQKMLSPFQAIIDRIWRFVFFTLLGRAFTKFMEWMSDKKNQDKFNAFIEFLSDHWPALAGLYILFGTSFGKLVRGLLKGATRMIIALVMNTGKIRKFIGKNKKLAFLGLALAPLATRELGNLLGENKETPESGLIPRDSADLGDAKKSVDQAANTQVPKLNLGGMIPSFKMGGMSPFGGMGGMDFYGGVPISGAGQDDTLIAAKTGEAILTERDQQDIGQRYVDRTTGQPLNIPQYLAGRKPGSIAMSNLRFPGFGGGFSSGGMISKFKDGGIVGGFSGGTNQFGESPLVRAALSSGIKGQELAAFLAQMSHETGGFKWSRELGRGEGMGYSGGSRYHGRGYTQLTHDYNYQHFGKKLGVDLVKDPDLLLKDPNLSARVAVEYWKERVRPKVKNWSDVLSHSAAINYPSATSPEQINGYGDRVNRFNYYVKNLKSIVSKNSPKPKSNKKSAGILNNFASFMPTSLPFFRGGLVKENTGMNIAGATADRQRVDVQPGEYILPLDTVNRLGVSVIDRLVAMTDSNSSAYLKKGSVNRPQITPYSSSGSGPGGMITLPPITQSAGGSRARSAGLGGGSEVPEFSATAPNNERAMNASIYGLVG